MQIALYLILRMGVRVRTLSTLTLFKGPGWDRRRRPSDDDDDNGVENQRSWLHSMALATVAGVAIRATVGTAVQVLEHSNGWLKVGVRTLLER